MTVDLLNGSGTSTIAVTTTDSNGAYHFTGLAPGSYEVQFVAPGGDVFTVQSAGGNPALDSNPNSTGLTGPITLTSGQTDNTIDAGVYKLASIGDYVWFDANGNGLQDAGTETGVAGVTVDLLNSTGSSTIAVTTTDSNGAYHFTSLTPGAYEVKFVAPGGDTFTTQTVGGNPALDSNPDSTGVTAPVTLTSGQVDNTIDAGLVSSSGAAIGDYVWVDNNADGVQNPGTETGLAGVTVDLLNGSGTSTIAVTTTDSNGFYHFTSLTPGAYEVKFIAPGTDVFTTQTVGSNPAIDSNPNPTTGITAPITLTSGQTDNTVDAGLYQKAAIGDYVWFDTNEDGVQSSGETGVAGVTVELLNAAGTSTLATTTTDSAGAYHFTNLTPGTYEVQFIKPSGDVFTTQMAGGNPALDSNPNASTGITAPITLTSGQTDNTIDAGLQGTAALGDYFWIDENPSTGNFGNGLQNGTNAGPGLVGATVELLNSSGATLLVTTTDSSGYYHFTGLAAGTYEVQFIRPSVSGPGYSGSAADYWSFTTQYAGHPTGGEPSSDYAIDSNPVAGLSSGLVTESSHGVPITLTNGQTDNTIDAGVVQTTKSGNQTLWLDSLAFLDNNANNIQNLPGDTGVAGATVEILTADGTKSYTSATTDSHGSAGNFVNGIFLLPNYYEVKFTAPSGYVIVGEQVTDPSGNTTYYQNTNGIVTPVYLGLATNSDPYQFNVALAKTATITGTAYSDINSDGIQESGESGVAGVTVNLLNAAGTSVVATTTTNSSGAYTFSGVNPGSNYEVQFVSPSGYGFSSPISGIQTVQNLSSGQTDSGVNAGLSTLLGKIGDYVWVDANGNGIQDSGESGLAGVTVELLNASGTSILQTTTTNASGAYQFIALPDVYEVEFVTPSGYQISPFGQGTDPSKDSSASPGSGITPLITLAPGAINNTIDAGFTPNSAVANTGLALDKVLASPSAPVAGYGDSLTYNYVVTNTGSTALTNIVVKDSVNGGAATPVGSTIASLAAGASTTIVASTTMPSGTPSAGTGSGFFLADAANYAAIAFGTGSGLSFSNASGTGKNTINGYLGLDSGFSTVEGNPIVIGSGPSAFTSAVSNTVVIGNIVTDQSSPLTLTATAVAGTTVYGNGALGNTATSGSDINALETMAATLHSQAVAVSAASVAVTGTQTITVTGLGGTGGTLDSTTGNIFYNVSSWTIGNTNTLTISADGSHKVVLDFNTTSLGSSNTINIPNIVLTGGITADQVLINDNNSSSHLDTLNYSNSASATSAGIWLAPNTVVNINGGALTLNGRIYAGANSNDFTLQNATVNMPTQVTAPDRFDMATATGTNSLGNTLVATDNSNVINTDAGSVVSATAGTATDFSTYGSPAKMEFLYNPVNGLAVQVYNGGSATVTGNLPPASSAFVTATDSAGDAIGGNTGVFFEGTVANGASFIADATTDPYGGSVSPVDLLPGTVYLHIFASQNAFNSGAAAVQEIAYNTGHASMGDLEGALKTIGYVGNVNDTYYKASIS